MESPEQIEVSAYRDLGRCDHSLYLAAARGEALTAAQLEYIGGAPARRPA